MNRFIINLRTLNAPEVTEPSQRQHFSRFSTPGFRVPQSFLGNIGEHLVHNDNLSFVDTDEERELSTQDSDGEMTSGRDTDQVLSPIAGVSPADGEDFEVSGFGWTLRNMLMDPYLSRLSLLHHLSRLLVRRVYLTSRAQSPV